MDKASICNTNDQLQGFIVSWWFVKGILECLTAHFNFFVIDGFMAKLILNSKVLTLSQFQAQFESVQMDLEVKNYLECQAKYSQRGSSVNINSIYFRTDRETFLHFCCGNAVWD